MYGLWGTKVHAAHTAHAARQNGQYELWYAKAQTYIYIVYIYMSGLLRTKVHAAHAAHTARAARQNGQHELWYAKAQTYICGQLK